MKLQALQTYACLLKEGGAFAFQLHRLMAMGGGQILNNVIWC